MVLSTIMKSLVLFMYVIVSGYVLTFGKSKTGIKMDYLFFSLFVLLALWNL